VAIIQKGEYKMAEVKPRGTQNEMPVEIKKTNYKHPWK
jgi:hypothetical protein